MPAPLLFRNRQSRNLLSRAQLLRLRLSSAVQEQLSVDGLFEGGGALGTAYAGTSIGRTAP